MDFGKSHWIRKIPTQRMSLPLKSYIPKSIQCLRSIDLGQTLAALLSKNQLKKYLIYNLPWQFLHTGRTAMRSICIRKPSAQPVKECSYIHHWVQTKITLAKSQSLYPKSKKGLFRILTYFPRLVRINNQDYTQFYIFNLMFTNINSLPIFDGTLFALSFFNRLKNLYCSLFRVLLLLSYDTLGAH